MRTVLVVTSSQLAPDGTVLLELGRPAQLPDGTPAGYRTTCRMAGVQAADAPPAGTTVTVQVSMGGDDAPAPVTVHPEPPSPPRPVRPT